MPFRKFTSEEIKFIRANRLKLPSRKLAAALSCSPSFIQAWLAKNNLTPSKKVLERFRVEGLRGRTSISPKDDRFIKENYLTIPVKRIAEMIGRSGTLVICRLRQLGLKIPRKIIEQRKKDSQRKKGFIPFNKGKKMATYCSRDVIKRIKKTQFKKGNEPRNTLFDGAIQIRHNHKERGSKPYKWIRIRKGYWEMLHVHNWVKKHGNVPDNHIIVFKNGDSMNCGLRNLKCISRQQHAENTGNSDGYIALKLSAIPGGKGKFDETVRKEVLKNKDLIDFKRTQLELNRTIKKRENES